MTLLPTFLAGTNWVMHSAGWLEGGLVAGYEKFIVDVELLQMLQVEFTPLEIDEDSLAFGAHEEVGHGGHFLGAMHTMERFRTCFYRPMLSSSDNYERWMRNGGLDAAGPRDEDLPGRSSRSTSRRRSTTPIRAELEEYVVRRRRPSSATEPSRLAAAAGFSSGHGATGTVPLLQHRGRAAFSLGGAREVLGRRGPRCSGRGDPTSAGGHDVPSAQGRDRSCQVARSTAKPGDPA